MTVNGLVSLRTCAEKIGVSHVYLSKLKKEGRFTDHEVPGKKRRAFLLSEVHDAVREIGDKRSRDTQAPSIDIFSPELAPESCIADMTDDEKREYFALMSEAAEARQEVEHNRKDYESEEIPAGTTLVAARTVKEYWLGQQAELKYKKEHGQLVDKQEVESQAYEMARMLRDKLLVIGDRISPIVASNNDRFACKQIIDKEITEVLENISAGLLK